MIRTEARDRSQGGPRQTCGTGTVSTQLCEKRHTREIRIRHAGIRLLQADDLLANLLIVDRNHEDDPASSPRDRRTRIRSGYHLVRAALAATRRGGGVLQIVMTVPPAARRQHDHAPRIHRVRPEHPHDSKKYLLFGNGERNDRGRQFIPARVPHQNVRAFSKEGHANTFRWVHELSDSTMAPPVPPRFGWRAFTANQGVFRTFTAESYCFFTLGRQISCCKRSSCVYNRHDSDGVHPRVVEPGEWTKASSYEERGNS